MADGGTTANRRRPRRAKPLTTPDPIEIAMTAEASGSDPKGIAHEVLRKQSTLIGWQVANERAAFALRLGLGLAAITVAAGVGLWAWTASKALGTVIEPFDTAPSLAANGLSGEAVANEVLSRMRAMQRAAGTSRPSRQSSNAAADAVDVVIPQTGVSVTEANRLLRSWLGRETHISGALRPSADGGLELTLRSDGRQVEVAAPPEAELASASAWIDAAAEATFRETDPYRYASWLAWRGRHEEALQLFGRLARSGPRSDRAWGWIGVSAILRNRGDFSGADFAARTSLALDAEQPASRLRLYEVSGELGRDESARHWAREAARSSRDLTTRLSHSVRARVYDNDWLGVVRETDRRMSRVPDWGSTDYPPSTISNWGRAYARLHEPTRAGQVLRDEDPMRDTQSLRAEAARLYELERWAELEATLARPWTGKNAVINAQIDRTVRKPWQGYVAAKLGRFDEARALIGGTPKDCYLCVRMRGRIEALAGQPAAADRWFAEAVRQAPSLADAEYEWAEAKRGRGDLAGALVLAREAKRKAPNWADPQKLEGDLLAWAGDNRRAVRAYAAAVRLAPRWGRLHLDWGQALAAQGEVSEARAKWRAAAEMDLTAAERTRLQTLLRQRAT